MPERTDNINEDDIEEREAEVNRTLFLRGVHEKMTEDELYELFLQAGPLEKVAIPQNKNIAFVTFKHSVSAPYAKELFCDSRLHGQLLNIDFRTGSIHSGNQRQSRDGGPRQSSSGSSHSHQHHRSHHSNSEQHGSRDPYGAHVTHGQQNGASYYSPQAMQVHAGLTNSPFAANLMSMPNVGIQGYRSSNNREYEPQYVSLDSPHASFRGSIPINHPNHPIHLEDRRQRLPSQQQYVTQADMQRNQNRYAHQRR